MRSSSPDRSQSQRLENSTRNCRGLKRYSVPMAPATPSHASPQGQSTLTSFPSSSRPDPHRRQGIQTYRCPPSLKERG